MRFTWHLRASPVSRKRRYSVVKTTKSDCIMLSREIVKLTRSNDRPGFHRGRNFFTRDSCNRAAAAFTKCCNYGWPVVAVDTDYKPAAGSRSRFSPTVFRGSTSRPRTRTGAKRDGGKVETAGTRTPGCIIRGYGSMTEAAMC